MAGAGQRERAKGRTCAQPGVCTVNRNAQVGESLESRRHLLCCGGNEVHVRDTCCDPVHARKNMDKGVLLQMKANQNSKTRSHATMWTSLKGQASELMNPYPRPQAENDGKWRSIPRCKSNGQGSSQDTT